MLMMVLGVTRCRTVGHMACETMLRAHMVAFLQLFGVRGVDIGLEGDGVNLVMVHRGGGDGGGKGKREVERAPRLLYLRGVGS